jgi:hypothetical protein
MTFSRQTQIAAKKYEWIGKRAGHHRRIVSTLLTFPQSSRIVPCDTMSSFHKLSLFLIAGFQLLALTPASITVMSSANPSVYGHPVTLTATVSPAGATGKVAFYNGPLLLETLPLVAGQAVFTTSLLPTGTGAIRARYSGDATYAASSSAELKQAVNSVPNNGFNLTSYVSAGVPAFGDFNGDGKVDLAGAPNLSVYLGNGDGTFQGPEPVGSTGGSVVAADFNGDGKADLAVATGSAVDIYLGKGDGTFQPAVTYLSGTSSYAAVAGDFNGDGNADLAVTETATNTVAILLGNGDGTFQSAVAWPVDSPIDTLVLGDFDGDGKTDLAVHFPYQIGYNGFAVLYGNGDGTLAAAVSYTEPLAVFALSAGDLNGDGNTDLAMAAALGAAVMLGNSDRTFQAPVNYNFANIGLEGVVIGDFNSDGKADIAVSGIGDGGNPPYLYMYYGHGDGTFEPDPVPILSPQSLQASEIGSSLATADLDGNGTADFLTGTYTNDDGIILGAAVTGVALTSSLNPSIFGQSVNLTATVSPARATGTVTFHEGNLMLGSGSLSGGIVSTSLSTLSVGSHSLIASYGGDGGDAAGASPILVQTVNPPSTPSTTTLSSSVNPSSLGQSITFTATVSPVTVTGTVSFKDGSQIFRTVALVSGTASIGISTLAAGSHAITAVYGGDLEVAGSTSPVLTQVVTAPDISSTTTLTSSLNPSHLGQSVTLTATVSPAVATGSVTFYNGPAVLGTATLAAGKASLSTVLLPFGQLALQARYSGGGMYAVSYSSVVVQSVKVFPETGFAATVSFNAGSQPWSVTSADFNGDGKPDLAVANRSGNNVSILLGNGDGTFQTPVNYAAGTNPQSVVAGDFNRDGYSDLAVANYSDNTFSVLLGDGDGTFQIAVNYPTGLGPASLQVGDFNRDGNADLAVANMTDGTVSIFTGNGDGTFGSPSTWPTDAGSVSLAIADFNGDGFADIATANSINNDVSILLGKSDGTFSQTVNYGVFPSPTSVAVGDFNGDGRPDLAIGLPGVNNYYIAYGDINQLIGNGDGTFQPPIWSIWSWANFQSVAFGDFTGQGVAGIAAADYLGSVVLFENGPGDPSYGSAGYPAGNGPTSIITGDFNRDGSTDIAVANRNSNDVSILLGIGRAISTTTLVSSLNPANYGQRVSLFVNVSPATATGTVTFYDGSAVLGTAPLGDGAQLDTSALPVGSHSLYAIYGGDDNVAGSTSATLIEQILPVVTLLPTSTLLTSSQNPSFGGAAAGNDSVTFTAAVSPSNATGTMTFMDGPAILAKMALAHGTATFSTASLAAGTHVITASYGGDTNYSGSVSALNEAVIPLTVPAPEPTPDPITGNLLVNPGAENGMNKWYATNAQSGSQQGLAHSGTHAFAGVVTPSTAVFITQTVGLSTLSGISLSDIDSGALTANYSFWFADTSPGSGGYGTITLTFLDGSGNRIGQEISPASGGGTLTWYNVVGSIAIPSGARSVNYTMDFWGGSGNTGVIDDNVLTISRNALTPNLLTNPGAETGNLTGWYAAYGAPPAAALSTSSYFGAGNGNSPHSGRYMFFGGATPNNYLTQTVNLSTVSQITLADVDAGLLTANYSFWYADKNGGTGSLGRITLSFYDGNRNLIVSDVPLEVKGATVNYGGATSVPWFNETGTFAIPPNTRSINYTMDFNGTTSQDSGVIDDNALTISRQ